MEFSSFRKILFLFPSKSKNIRSIEFFPLLKNSFSKLVKKKLQHQEIFRFFSCPNIT